jgi:hypothetical protein
MQTCSAREALVLPVGQITSFILSEPMQVQIESGRVWLTISGMAEDFWLADGEVLALPAHRRVVIEAYKAASQITLCAAPERFSNAVGLHGRVIAHLKSRFPDRPSAPSTCQNRLQLMKIRQQANQVHRIGRFHDILVKTGFH